MDSPGQQKVLHARGTDIQEDVMALDRPGGERERMDEKEQQVPSSGVGLAGTGGKGEEHMQHTAETYSCSCSCSSLAASGYDIAALRMDWQCAFLKHQHQHQQ